MKQRMTAGLMGLAVLGLMACGGEEAPPEPLDSGYSVSDSLVPIADAAVLPDESPAVEAPPPAPAPRPAAPRPTPRPVSAQPAPPPAPTPAPAPAPLGLASGVTLSTTTLDSIHSRYNKPGDLIRTRVASDVKDSEGRVVIPAGSVVTLAVLEIAPAANKGATPTLVLSARNVEINGLVYRMTARVTDIQSELKSRGVGASEVAKTGGGAVVGGILGRVIGGGKTGTIIGAVGGAAAGAAVANETVDRDIVVRQGNTATIVLRDDFILVSN